MTGIPKEIQQDLEKINVVCKDLQMKLYVVGGLPRDMVAGYPVDDDTDLDVTEQNGNAFDLAFFVAAKYGLPEPQIYESSGTALVVMPSGREVEFHNAFYNVPHIIDELYKLGVKPTPMNKDVYSRDFTINTLLLDSETKEILDITGLAQDDIKNKILRTPLDPMKTTSIDPKRVLRGIRFKCQFDLQSTDEYEAAVQKYIPMILDFMQKHPNSNMIKKTVQKAFQFNAELAYQEFSKLGLLPYIPKETEIEKFIKNHYLGLNITKDASVKTAQTKMIQRLLNERENHKAYLRRKKRENQQQRAKRWEILDKAKTGYYLDNPEERWVNRRNKKLRRAPGYEFVKHPR